MSDTVAKLTLWGVEVFLTVADEGFVSAAAKRLGASPSAISQQITGLEAAVGAELLNRNTRPMTLTPAGRILRGRAQTILNEAARARSEIAGLDLTQLEQLRLGMVEDFDAAVTPQLIAGMAGQLTDTRFELETGPSHRLLDHLEHRTLDIVVAAELGPHAEWMEVRALLRDPFVVVVPKGHTTVPTREDALPFIGYTRRHAMGRSLSDHISRENYPIDQRFEMDSYRAMLAMVAAKEGWTILSILGVQHAGRFAADIDVLPLPFAPLDRVLSLYTRTDGVREMADEIAARLRPALERDVVTPALAAWPWLAGKMAMLDA